MLHKNAGLDQLKHPLLDQSSYEQAGDSKDVLVPL